MLSKILSISLTVLSGAAFLGSVLYVWFANAFLIGFSTCSYVSGGLLCDQFSHGWNVIVLAFLPWAAISFLLTFIWTYWVFEL